MLDITLAELRHGLRRFVAPAIAIVLGVAFVTATLALSSTMEGTLARTAAAEVAGRAAVVSGGALGPEELREIRSLPGISGVDAEQRAFVPAKSESGTVSIQATTAVPDRIDLVSGQVAQQPDHVVLNQEAAAALGATPGSTVTIGGSPGVSERVTVAGVGKVTGRDQTGSVVAPAAQISRWAGNHDYQSLLVTSANEPEQVVAQVRAALGPTFEVRTGAAETEHRVTEMVMGIRYITMFFGLFAVIALVVAGLVIANTFQILLAGRARQLALLRCVGASRRQVRQTVLAESLALGLVASALGVLVGVGVVAGLVQLSDRMEVAAFPLESLAVAPSAVFAPLALGTVTTVLAALQSARRASRIAPLAALRPEQAAALRSRASRVRLALGGMFALTGFAATAFGAVAAQAPVAVVGGAVSFLGVFLIGPITVPTLARIAGRMSSRFAGVPGELATDNTVRNPRRTAATSSALLIGITLMASMLVGASTTKTAIDGALDQQFAVDIAIEARPSNDLPASIRRTVASQDGVDAHAQLYATTAEVVGPRLSHKQPITGVSTTAREVLRDPALLDGLAPGRVLIDEATATDFGLAQGDSVRIDRVPLTVHLTDRDAGSLLVTRDDLGKIDADAKVASMWLRIASDADPGAVTGSVRKAVAPVGANVAGSAGARAELDTMVSVMLMIVAALLGVAILIALVGVTNTLGLSVLERRRETALLRALGFTARQVRRTLALEALLVAVIAAVLGTSLGVFYGWTGTHALLGKYADGVAPQIPVTMLAALILAAAGCGLLTSWAPARRAARTSPVSALAAD